MKVLKNILIGFLVSFVGSIPLGYLNVIGFEIYKNNSLTDLFLYLFGVIIIEGIIIYASLIFAEQLTNNKKLLHFIQIFSIIFLFILAAVFFVKSSKSNIINQNILENYAPFLLGLFFSVLNFVQIPFWLGWNLYLLNNRYILINSNIKWFYILGTVTGTFVGMLCFVFLLYYASSADGFVSSTNLELIIPLIFFVMGCFQTWKYFKKDSSQ